MEGEGEQQRAPGGWRAARWKVSVDGGQKGAGGWPLDRTLPPKSQVGRRSPPWTGSPSGGSLLSVKHEAELCAERNVKQPLPSGSWGSYGVTSLPIPSTITTSSLLNSVIFGLL